VRSISLLSGLLLFVMAESAAMTVKVDKPRIELLSRDAITAKCNGTDRLACTSIATRMISSCATDRGQWHPLTMVAISSQVFTSSAELLTHEFSHIADIRKSLEAQARSIEAHIFASEDECLAFIVRTGAALPKALLAIESDTDHKRDPHGAFARPTPLAAEISGLSINEDQSE
jgi:hypothetical protein